MKDATHFSAQIAPLVQLLPALYMCLTNECKEIPMPVLNLMQVHACKVWCCKSQDRSFCLHATEVQVLSRLPRPGRDRRCHTVSTGYYPVGSQYQNM